VSEPGDMKQTLVGQTCGCSNDCAAIESYTILLLDSSSGNIPSCSWPNHLLLVQVSNVPDWTDH